MNTKEIIQKMISDATDWIPLDFQIEKPKSDFGDYAVNAAFVLAKKQGRAPAEIAKELAEKLDEGKPEEIEKIEAVGGYVNFFLSNKYLQDTFEKIAKDKNYGRTEKMEGQTIMVEYTDANPFKLFHIGHLMSNSIGEAIARMYEANGAKVIRANYQGDVGLHVAMTIWAMRETNKLPPGLESSKEKVEYLGKCYVAGSKAYRDESSQNTRKTEIEKINDKIYSKSDAQINELYALGKKWSLEYFEEIYKILGTKFNEYFFESQAGKDGLDLILKNKKIFLESDGAIIFRGEDYGLHTRVFVNKNGLPTYEAKELGLNKKKFELYPLSMSVIITGNEINEYFRVLFKVMELIIPEVADKTRHVGHGMLRLPTGKMSSRTGEVVTAESLIESVKAKLLEISLQSKKEKSEGNDIEAIAIGAIKYSILKQSPGKDIIFDFDKSLSVEGDSGPYLQYTYARLHSILEKGPTDHDSKTANPELLTEKSELDLVRHLIELPEVIERSGQNIAPHHLALYLYQLANLANSFYEKVRILTDENKKRLNTRLVLVGIVANTLETGLNLLGIKTLPRI